MVWNKTELKNIQHPKYLGVTLDRTLCYKKHIHNTKMKVATRNNLLRNLSNSKWGANANTIRTTALALSYSVAEYAAPIWARSPHAKKLEYGTKQCTQRSHRMPETNQCRRSVFASWNSPPDIRREVCARMEKTKQETNEVHSLDGQHPAERRLKSRNCFLRSVKPAEYHTV